MEKEEAVLASFKEEEGLLISCDFKQALLINNSFQRQIQGMQIELFLGKTLISAKIVALSLPYKLNETVPSSSPSQTNSIAQGLWVLLNVTPGAILNATPL